MEKNLYEQAILDAKTLRASAIANAKAMLEEAFEPKIQEMLRLKLAEDLDEDYAEEAKDMEEGEYHVDEDSVEITETELDEILSELEGMDEAADMKEDADMEEGEDMEESLNEAEDDDDQDVDAPTEDAPEGDEDMEVTIKFSDLKDVLAPFVTGEEEDEAPEGDEGEEDVEELSLDEILAELEETKHDMEEAKAHKKEMEEKKHTYKEKQELKEAKKTIVALSEKLQEVNLLNAKLLYMNKIFKAKNLDESQKIKVVKSFDKASTVNEVKNVYEILSESMSATKKAPLKESRVQGFASKPSGVAPKTPIVDSDPTAERWQQLVFGR